MKKLLVIMLLGISGTALSQKNDTIVIDASKINTKALIPGTHRYLVYFKMGKDSSRKSYQFWSRTIDFIQFRGKEAISVTQEWEDNDTIIHKVYSVCDKKTFAPLYQESWRRGRGSSKVDFGDQSVYLNDVLLTKADTASSKKRAYDAFQIATTSYTLNWHLDLEVFPLLPYVEGKTFVINFYDPGLAFPPSKETYTVIGSAKLKLSNDIETDCWLLKHGELPKNLEIFWINKKTREVMKLDQEFNGIFRYKIKLGFSS